MANVEISGWYRDYKYILSTLICLLYQFFSQVGSLEKVIKDEQVLV